MESALEDEPTVPMARDGGAPSEHALAGAPQHAEPGALFALAAELAIARSGGAPSAHALARTLPRAEAELARGAALPVARGGGAPNGDAASSLQAGASHGCVRHRAATFESRLREPSWLRRPLCQILPVLASAALASECSGAAAALYTRPISEAPLAPSTAFSKQELRKVPGEGSRRLLRGLLNGRVVVAESLSAPATSWQPLTCASTRIARGGGAPLAAVMNPQGNGVDANVGAKAGAAPGIITIGVATIGIAACGNVPKGMCRALPQPARVLPQPATDSREMYGEGERFRGGAFVLWWKAAGTIE